MRDILKWSSKNAIQMEETMLKISKFGHNRHPSGVKLLAKNIRRGIRVV